MNAFDMEQVFETNLIIKQDLKSPCSEDITARVEHKSGDEVDWIDIFEGCDDIPQINLGKEQSEQDNGYEDRKYFCQKFIVHDFPDCAVIWWMDLKTIFICFSLALLISNVWLGIMKERRTLFPIYRKS